MATNDTLTVWYGLQRIGQLWRNEVDMIGLRYDEDWQDNGFAISQQLPLTTTSYPPESVKAHKFFANLLPEADARMTPLVV